MSLVDEITINFDENFKSKQDLRDIERSMILSKSNELWEFDVNAINCCSNLKQILLQFCNYKLFLFNLELINPGIISFCCNALRKHIIFKTNINLKPMDCNMLEFIDSIQLLFRPELESITFIIDQGDSLNLHIVVKLGD